MSYRMQRRHYADIYGPTTGDRVRLAALPSHGAPRGPPPEPTQTPEFCGKIIGYAIRSALMQFLADYFPLVLFFVAFKLWDIYVATAVAIVASVLQIAYFRWRGKVQVVHWVSLAIIVVFGGATLLLHDETFIKWKPTVLYWLFGAILAVGRLAFRRNLLAALMKGMALPDPIWARVT